MACPKKRNLGADVYLKADLLRQIQKPFENIEYLSLQGNFQRGLPNQLQGDRRDGWGFLTHILILKMAATQHVALSAVCDQLFPAGWSRYDHFASLCELLPVALPSLILR